MTHTLDSYQDTFLEDIGAACRIKRSVLAQLETGGGKTVIFSTIAKRFLDKSKKDVIIFVDSDNIFKQTRKTLSTWYGIDSDTINRESAHIKRNTLFGLPRVFVAMVETFDRRAQRETFLHQIRDVGLVIIDECHMGNFYKIMEHFPFALRIGFTATPIASDKKKPLRNYWDTIVCGPTTSDLIEFNRTHPGRGVVRDITYSLQNNINRKEIEQEELALGYKGEDFNQELVGSKLAGKRQIQNTIDAIVEHAAGKKLLCFNANISHSKAVTEEMCKYGLNARHMDSNCTKEYIDDCYRWLKETPNAILCNVGMTTKGFDEPSVEGTVLNTLTKSITKFRQMCGRSARPFRYPDGSYKQYHIILDMCDNVLGGGHGQWSDDRDWKYMFENPRLPKPGVAPAKECPECGAICAASARKCRGLVEDFFANDGSLMECGYEFEVKTATEDVEERKMVLISKDVDVSKIINFPKFQGKKMYYTFHETVRACAYYYKMRVPDQTLVDKDQFDELWATTYLKIVEWQRLKGAQSESGRKIRDTEWFTKTGRADLKRFLEEYGFIVNLVDTVTI